MNGFLLFLIGVLGSFATVVLALLLWAWKKKSVAIDFGPWLLSITFVPEAFLEPPTNVTDGAP